MVVVFILLFIYFLVEKNFLISLARLRMVVPENTPHNWEVLTNNFTYAANNIFDKGYVREIDPDLHNRLFSYPGNLPINEVSIEDSLVSGKYIVIPNNKEEVIKMVLPKGFKNGVLELSIAANSAFKIETSYDLKSWVLNDFQSFVLPARYDLNFNEENFSRENLYLKFISPLKEGLRVHFDVFQYTTDSPIDKNETEGIFFFPETDIDYEGKEIERPIMYLRKQ